MHNLSRRIAIALQHEERRCQYLTREAKLMLAVQEEITTGAEGELSSSALNSLSVWSCVGPHTRFLSWLKATEVLSLRLDKSFPNASWPEI